MRQEIISLIGKTVPFLSDKHWITLKGKDYYTWQAGDLCLINGYIPTPANDPIVMLCLELEPVEFCEFHLSELGSVVDLTRIQEGNEDQIGGENRV